ncbi:MAG: transporter [Hyphomicrobiales bacterium]|nr:MAG: transporter [Hyphomicrobiales bacterium]
MKRIFLTSMLALSVSACSINPKPLTTGSVSEFASNKLARVTADQDPISQSISLHEAMARALKFNLDFHVEIFNQALASRQLATARLDTLPKLAASALYSGRDNVSGNKASVLFPDREKYVDDISLSWNILDFGLSYVRAQQAADEVLIAEERRRKIVNRVIEDVRTAYWRAVSADRLVSGLRKLEGRAQKALANSKAIESEGQTSPLTALTYQRELLEIQQRIQRLQKDLSLAKVQLAALMNIRPGENFSLAQPTRYAHSTELKMSGEEMVFAALENRPEIRDVQYKLRINEKETKRALLQLLPGVNLFASANWDSDSYLYNSNWIGWGAKATWNVMQVFKYPAQKRLIKAKEELLDARALAVTMAIMTQVHVSRIRYGHTRKLYKTAARHLKVQKGIVDQIRSSHAEGQASEQTLIREEMNTLASNVATDIAYADLQNAYANVFASMGLDPYQGDFSTAQPLDRLTASLREMWIERGDRSGLTKALASAKSWRASKDAMYTGSVGKTPSGNVIATSSGWVGLTEAKPKVRRRVTIGRSLSQFLSGGSASTRRAVKSDR